VIFYDVSDQDLFDISFVTSSITYYVYCNASYLRWKT